MNALREARLLGQRTEILSAIETGDAHPAMAAFGLLASDEEWDSIHDRRIVPWGALLEPRLPGGWTVKYVLGHLGW